MGVSKSLLSVDGYGDMIRTNAQHHVKETTIVKCESLLDVTLLLVPATSPRVTDQDTLMWANRQVKGNLHLGKVGPIGQVDAHIFARVTWYVAGDVDVAMTTETIVIVHVGKKGRRNEVIGGS